MATNASLVRKGTDDRPTAAAAATAGDLWQLRSGRPGVLRDSVAPGDQAVFNAADVYTLPKAAGVVLLDGGRVYWDHSAGVATYRRAGHRDFYVGRVVGDAASADTTCAVNLGVDPPYDLDLTRDVFRTAVVGGATLAPRGGGLNLQLTSANEAQKADALSVDTFATGARAIVELAFAVPSDGAGSAPDVSLGVAAGTHASDASAIGQRLFCHLDGNSPDVRFEGADGTTTVALTDSTVDYTEGAALASRVEVWFDLRDPANVKLYVNGARVLSGTTFSVAAAAAEWQLLCHLEKTAAADVYEFDLHWLRARLGEQ